MTMPKAARIPNWLRALAADERGATVMEFGLMITVFVTLLLGLFDIGQMAYTQSILNGAVQDAARLSALEGADSAAADARVLELVKIVAPSATMETDRESYASFADIGRPERWNDANNDGTCSEGESYVDENGNGNWDVDIGQDGNGGAEDVVIYTVTVTYEPLFPNPFLSGGRDDRQVQSSAIKKNQPFSDQEEYGSDAGTCE
jgi:hypothetical protein